MSTPSSENIVETAAKPVEAVAKKVSEAVASSPTTTKLSESADKIKNVAASNSGKIIIAIVLLFIVLYVIVYVYKLYNSTSLKTTTLLKKPISIPFTETNITNDIQLPRNAIGNQYSISFWVYVDDISPTKKDKFLLSRGREVEFYIDKQNNLNVEVGPTMLSYKNFPTNRWVSVILIVDETLATLYVDSKFSEAKTSTYGKISGNVLIGKANYKERVEGYLSKVQLFNYALTIDHAQIVYKAGPLHKSILSMIGIPMYGLRNPFIRLDEVKVD